MARAFVLIFSILITALQSASAVAASRVCSEVFKEGAVVMDSLRVAAVQYPQGEGKTFESFIAKVEGYLIEAKEKNAQLIVFPELITLELVDLKSKIPEKNQLAAIADEVTPRYIAWLKDSAKRFNIAIMGGTTPRRVGLLIKNTAILAMADGKTVMQDKIFLTPDEKAWGWSPGESLEVFSSPWGSTVITTCFDCEFPMVSEGLVNARPDLILVPSWTSSLSGLNRVDWTAKSRAVEHYAFVIKTGTIPDPSSQQSHFGRASIIGPQDTGFSTEIIEGELNKSQIIIGDLDLAQQRKQKSVSGYYPGHEQQQRRTPFSVQTKYPWKTP